MGKVMGRRAGNHTLTAKAQEEMWEYVRGGYKELGHQIPSAAGLAKIASVSLKTIHMWSVSDNVQCNPVGEFPEIYSAMMVEQQLRLLNKGLSGDFNPAITKMILTKHGYSDNYKIAGIEEGDAIKSEQKWVIEVVNGN
jgi:hypothetical protein